MKKNYPTALLMGFFLLSFTTAALSQTTTASTPGLLNSTTTPGAFTSTSTTTPGAFITPTTPGAFIDREVPNVFVIDSSNFTDVFSTTGIDPALLSPPNTQSGQQVPNASQ